MLMFVIQLSVLHPFLYEYFSNMNHYSPLLAKSNKSKIHNYWLNLIESIVIFVFQGLILTYLV